MFQNIIDSKLENNEDLLQMEINELSENISSNIRVATKEICLEIQQ